MLLLLCCLASHVVFGQVEEEAREQAEFVKAYGIKSQRQFLAKAGFFKLQDPRIEKEVFFDEEGRVVRYLEHGYNDNGYYPYKSVESFHYDSLSNISLYHKSLDNNSSPLKIGYVYDHLRRLEQVIVYKPGGVQQLNSVGDKRVPNPLWLKLSKLFIYPFEGLNANIPGDSGHNFQIIDSHGNLLREKRVVVNQQKQVVQLISSDNIKKDVVISNYKYNKLGYVAEYNEVNKKGKLLIKDTYFYNDKNLLERVVSTNGKDKIVKIVQYQYEYFKG